MSIDIKRLVGAIQLVDKILFSTAKMYSSLNDFWTTLLDNLYISKDFIFGYCVYLTITVFFSNVLWVVISINNVAPVIADFFITNLMHLSKNNLFWYKVISTQIIFSFVHALFDPRKLIFFTIAIIQALFFLLYLQIFVPDYLTRAKKHIIAKQWLLYNEKGVKHKIVLFSLMLFSVVGYIFLISLITSDLLTTIACDKTNLKNLYNGLKIIFGYFIVFFFSLFTANCITVYVCWVGYLGFVSYCHALAYMYFPEYSLYLGCTWVIFILFGMIICLICSTRKNFNYVSTRFAWPVHVYLTLHVISVIAAITVKIINQYHKLSDNSHSTVSAERVATSLEDAINLYIVPNIDWEWTEEELAYVNQPIEKLNSTYDILYPLIINDAYPAVWVVGAMLWQVPFWQPSLATIREFTYLFVSYTKARVILDIAKKHNAHHAEFFRDPPEDFTWMRYQEWMNECPPIVHPLLKVVIIVSTVIVSYFAITLFLSWLKNNFDLPSRDGGGGSWWPTEDNGDDSDFDEEAFDDRIARLEAELAESERRIAALREEGARLDRDARQTEDSIRSERKAELPSTVSANQDSNNHRSSNTRMRGIGVNPVRVSPEQLALLPPEQRRAVEEQQRAMDTLRRAVAVRREAEERLAALNRGVPEAEVRANAAHANVSSPARGGHPVDISIARRDSDAQQNQTDLPVVNVPPASQPEESESLPVSSQAPSAPAATEESNVEQADRLFTEILELIQHSREQKEEEQKRKD